jgi:hypothetical protein
VRSALLCDLSVPSAAGQDGRCGKWQAYLAGMFRKKAGIE